MDLARSLGVAERVSWVGGLSDTNPAYGAADVLLHPSIYDAFGLVVAEAMAHGVPPIVSHTSGIAELVEHGVSGWVVRPREPEDSIVALRSVVADPELGRRLGANARSVANSRTWDVVAEETLAVYEEAAS
jgi:glycosyltransferase involved in cell wall biosynthesis